jgi:hypothetical protein
VLTVLKSAPQPAETLKACPGIDLPLPFTLKIYNDLTVNTVASVKRLMYKNSK